MKCNIEKFDLDSFLATMVDILPAGPAYDVIGLQRDYTEDDDPDRTTFLKDELLNKGSYLFFPFHESRCGGEAFKCADGKICDPKSVDDGAWNDPSPDSIFGLEVSVDPEA